MRPGERIDDLQRCGCRIIQNEELFCFGMDAVLLAAFAQPRISAGAKVCVIGSRPEEAAAEALAEFGDSAAYYRFDITDTEHIPALVERMLADHGRIDILVNNAGNHCKKFIWDMTVED